MPVLSLVCPDDGIVSLESKVVEALELQTALVNSKLRLFKSGEISVTSVTTLELLDSVQCDFDGYTADGVTIAAFGDPIVDDAAETVLIAAPSKQFNWTHVADDVANDVGGAYLVDSDGALRGVVEFPDPVTMQDELDGLSVQFTFRV